LQRFIDGLAGALAVGERRKHIGRNHLPAEGAQHAIVFRVPGVDGDGPLGCLNAGFRHVLRPALVVQFQRDFGQIRRGQRHPILRIAIVGRLLGGRRKLGDLFFQRGAVLAVAGVLQRAGRCQQGSYEED